MSGTLDSSLQEWLAHSTGELAEDYCPDCGYKICVCDAMDAALQEANDVLSGSESNYTATAVPGVAEVHTASGPPMPEADNG